MNAQKFITKFKVRLREFERRFVRFLGGRSNRDIEYDFAYRNITNMNLRILDIGGCDSLLPVQLARGGANVTVYDFRSYPERHSNLRVIQGDFLRNNLESNSFDIVILVSTIEHIGLGGYGAPEYQDADLQVISEIRRLLVDNGKAILSFPFNEKEKIIPGFERWYTPERVRRLFDGWFILDAEFWVPQVKIFRRWVKWRPAMMQDAARAYQIYGEKGFACFVISFHPLIV